MKNLVIFISILLVANLFAMESKWEEMRPTVSVGAEIMSTTMVAIPIAVGLQYEIKEKEMIYMTCYFDDYVPVVIQTRGSYSPYYWAMSIGFSKRFLFSDKLIGYPAKRFYVSPFIGTDFIPRWRANFGIKFGVDFR
jgi:hypothetical protein